MPEDLAYVVPVVNSILVPMENAFENKFGHPFVVTSAVRSEEAQRRLRRSNRNATLPELSAHSTGATVDVARKKMNRAETKWMEDYLKSLGSAVIVEEENHQACFHIFCRRSYVIA